MDPQYFHTPTSSIQNIRLSQRSTDKESVDLARQYIPLSCPRRLELLCASSPVWEIPEDIFALMGAKTNLRSLRIIFRIGHCTYTLIDSIVNHLSFGVHGRFRVYVDNASAFSWYYRPSVTLRQMNPHQVPESKILRWILRGRQWLCHTHQRKYIMPESVKTLNARFGHSKNLDSEGGKNQPPNELAIRHLCRDSVVLDSTNKVRRVNHASFFLIHHLVPYS